MPILKILATSVTILMLQAGSGAPQGAAPGANQADRPQSVRWLGEGGRKIQVSLGIVLIDFARVNIREESFDMAGYLDTSWVDPSLALKPEEPSEGVRRYRPGQVWTPELEFVNAVEQVKGERDGDLYVSDHGRVTQRVRFSHKFSSALDLRRFPFDRQTLGIVVVPFDPFAKDIDLVIDRRRVGQLPEASVSDWSLEGVDAKVVATPGGDALDNRFLFEVKISRRSTFYVWRVLLPMTLLVVASWTVFWFEVTNLQPQISTCLAILLSLVTFNYAIDFSLPKVPYLTFIDRYTLMSFTFVLLAIFAVSTVHVTLQRKGAERASRLQTSARRLFPALFLASIASLALFSFR